MGEVKVTQRNPNFPANERFRVRIEACKYVVNHDGVEYFIIEAEVLESSTDALKPGTIASQVIQIPGTYKMGLANVKAFLAAANGIHPGNTAAVEEALSGTNAEEAAVLAVSAENPLKGIELDLQTTFTVTKNGRDFTIHAWSPIDEE